MLFNKPDRTVIPNFKYHLDPFQSKVFEQRDSKCPICKKKVSFVYVGPFYSNQDVDGICPWCISDGQAARKYDGEFQDTQTIEGEISENAKDELIRRTPGYIAWQQAEWLVHCNEPCQFIAYVGWKELEEIGVDVVEDIEKQAKNYGLSIEEFKERLFNEGALQGYLFRCVKCGKYRLTSDCD
jgi:uncharacterized protein CbrC (UPF0167 family)